jgi:predicted bacteriocin transport accessory protein
MKKLFITVILLGLILSGCSSAGLTQVKPTEITEKFEANETFVVYLGLSYCSACKIFRSIVESVIKETGTTVYYIEYDKESQEDLDVLVNTHLTQNEAFPYSFPIIFVVEEGKILDQFSLAQTDTEDEFKALLIKNGVIEE